MERSKIKSAVLAELRRLGIILRDPSGIDWDNDDDDAPTGSSGRRYKRPTSISKRSPEWLRVAVIVLLAVAAAVAGPKIIHWPPDGPGVHVYAQTRVLVHDAPDGNATVARILQAGDRVEIEATGPSAWVTVFDEPGHRIGYSFRTRQNLLPTRPRLPPPTDTTALCTDGTSSFSVHASGTCSQHGGVLCWRSHPDPQPVRVSKPYCRSFPADHQEDS